MSDNVKHNAIATIARELSAARDGASSSVSNRVTQLGLGNTTDAVRATQDRLGRIARGEVDMLSGWYERKFILEPGIKLADKVVEFDTAIGRIVDAQNDLTRKATVGLEVSAGYQAAMLTHGVSIFSIAAEIMHHVHRQQLRHQTETEHDRLQLEIARQEHHKAIRSYHPAVEQHVAREVAAQIEADADVAAARAAYAPHAAAASPIPSPAGLLETQRSLRALEANALAAGDMETATRLQAAMAALATPNQKSRK